MFYIILLTKLMFLSLLKYIYIKFPRPFLVPHKKKKKKKKKRKKKEEEEEEKEKKKIL